MKKIVNTTTALICVIALTGCATISPQEVGLKVSKAGTSRGVTESNIVNGYQLFNPLTTEIVTYPKTVQGVEWKGEEAITFKAKGGLQVTAPVGFNFRVNPQKAPNIYVYYGADITRTMNDNIKKIVQKSMNDVGGQFTPEQLVGSGGSIFEAKVNQDLNAKLANIGFIVENFNLIEGVHPPQSVTDSITASQKATQDAIRVENELRSVKAEAAKKVATAQGELDAARLKAQANKVLSSSLTADFIKYQRLTIEQAQVEVNKAKVEKWNGENPSTVLGSETQTLVTVK